MFIVKILSIVVSSGHLISGKGLIDVIRIITKNLGFNRPEKSKGPEKPNFAIERRESA